MNPPAICDRKKVGWVERKRKPSYPANRASETQQRINHETREINEKTLTQNQTLKVFKTFRVCPYGLLRLRIWLGFAWLAIQILLCGVAQPNLRLLTVSKIVRVFINDLLNA